MEHSKLTIKDANKNGDLYIGPTDGSGYMAIVVREPFNKDARATTRERADFIVTACNNHQDLLDLARNIANGVDIDQGSVERLVAEIEE